MPQSHATASEPRLLTALAGQPPEDLQDVGADVQVCLLDLIEHGAHLRQMPLPFGPPPAASQIIQTPRESQVFPLPGERRSTFPEGGRPVNAPKNGGTDGEME